MKLSYFQQGQPNFGDALNPWLWRGLLPDGFLDEDSRELFLGAGSILWNDYPGDARKYVVGSGYGGYARPPRIDSSWEVVFVRGPRTAQMLELPPELAICDSAVLLRTLDLPEPAEDVGVAFMPHIHSLNRADWGKVCAHAGMTMLDPRDDVVELVAKIRGAEMVITEAMHGAIVADALRVPWLPVEPIHSENRMKWFDWAESVDIRLRPERLRPASLLELYIKGTGGRRYYQGRAREWNDSAAARLPNRVLIDRAARHLVRLKATEPMLSADTRMEEVTERGLTALHAFVERHRANRRSATP